MPHLLKHSQSRGGPDGSSAFHSSVFSPASVSTLQIENCLCRKAFKIVVIKKKKERFILEKVGNVEFLYFVVGMFIFITCQ